MSKIQFQSYQTLTENYSSDYIPYSELLKTIEWREIRKEILIRDKNKCIVCEALLSKGVFMQVHHTYYIRDTLPWDYPDECLATLCSSCHSLLHQVHRVIVYELIDGQMIDIKAEPCKRCGGKGGFSQYKYIEDGICFRCRGNRYEKLLLVSGKQATKN